MPRKLIPIEDRFWRLVDKRAESECWPWTGTANREGYGQIRVSTNPARFIRAPRLSYIINKGPLQPADVIRHSCDNPRCVNPAHLAVGTHADNVADKVSRGRQSCGPHDGTNNPRAILNEDLVRAIRASPLSHGKLAAEIGVSRGTIAAVRARRTWAHVP